MPKKKTSPKIKKVKKTRKQITNPADAPGGPRPDEDPRWGGISPAKLIRETQPPHSSRQGRGPEQVQKDKMRRQTGKKSKGK